MTALIAAMNNRAVAMAADSAITINSSSSHKVLNSANKLFQLSPNHSVGIMICGNASYLGLPWEIIIKEYGKQLGNKPFFNLQEYRNDFLRFLLKNNHFCSKSHQIKYLIDEITRLHKYLLPNPMPSDTDEIKKFFIERADNILNDAADSIEGLLGYSFDEFFKEFGKDLTAHCSTLWLTKHFPDLKEKLLKCFHKFIIRNNSLLNVSESQIVFAGYGSYEIRPSLSSISIWFGFGSHIRYDKHIEQSVTEDHDAAISRYAQTDIINTFINGINPKLRNSIEDNIPGILAKILDQLAATFTEKDIQDKIKGFDVSRVKQLFNDLIDRKSREQFSNPLISTIGDLDTSDLISFVESLISLTGLHRRMSGMEEGVGGPVDVAIITKSDGFTWVKHKSLY